MGILVVVFYPYVVYSLRMDRRTPAAVVAANVTAASVSRGVTISTLTDAAGVPVASLIGTPDAVQSELNWGQLQDIGGVLSVSPALFFEGVPSA